MTRFDDLISIIQTLRHPISGCPWDKEQTASSLIPNFIEEVYEAVEAIEDDDPSGLCEELGDITLHVIFQALIAEEKGHFSLDDVLSRVIEKLIRRHPHVFQQQHIGESRDLDALQVQENWEKIKLAEKSDSRVSVLQGIPRNLPALIQASRMQEKAARVGFDWDTYEPIFDKINEEIDEVRQEINKRSLQADSLAISTDADDLEMEVGDLLFAVVNLARKLGIDSESALRKSNQKFSDRFQRLERLCSEKKINMPDVGLEVLDELWEYIKKNRVL
jgi:MazG family protein